MTKPNGILWLEIVEEHNFAAAESYLSLIYPVNRVAEIIAGLRSATIVQFKAKDIFRHMERDIEKIQEALGLSPILINPG